jgi:hypothetical protein
MAGKPKTKKPRKQMCVDCCKRRARENHHVIPRCEGGTETIPLCRECHVARHVKENEWARWGQKGGKKTAKNKMNWIPNLKQYRSLNQDLELFDYGSFETEVEFVL